MKAYPAVPPTGHRVTAIDADETGTASVFRPTPIDIVTQGGTGDLSLQDPGTRAPQIVKGVESGGRRAQHLRRQPPEVPPAVRHQSHLLHGGFDSDPSPPTTMCELGGGARWGP